ncbi:hypothetical protein [Scytonema sp. UIC 10036]|uniref:hypothetical protein n=1 Tax=Scytonema sp. UIC 10036 TaxID=2304196 RepID=UPI001A9B693F|nr:hypothetical protein [Scytonema sp. UIC 10036]
MQPAITNAQNSVRDTENLSAIVLCPKAEVIAARDAARSKTGYANEAMVYAFDRILRTETPRLVYWLDSSNLTVEEMVDRILTNFQFTLRYERLRGFFHSSIVS